ncbi:MAG: hypothetical protein ACYTFG_16790 [Planctomycetota bacterium]|jgi:hypothetical protein
MNSRRRESGVVLLLVLMVMAILIVVVGEFSTSAVLDWRIARNREMEARLALDVRSGVEAALLSLADRDEDEEGPFALSIVRETSSIRVRVEDEAGKFNVNGLLLPPEGISQSRAESVFRRLMDLADDPTGNLPAGCADSVISFVRESGSPLPTLGALLSVEGITPDVLWGGEQKEGGSGGLSSLLTVHGDGRIRLGAGDDRVMLALSPKLTPSILAQALAYIRKPTPTPPAQVAALAQDVLPWTTWESSDFTARVEVSREGASKSTRAILHDEGGDLGVALCDELK